MKSSFLSLCLLLFTSICLASQSELSRFNQCQLDRINALEPDHRVESEAGLTETWNPRHPELQCAGVTLIRRTIDPEGLHLPSFSPDPQLVIIQQGKGVIGMSVPGCPETYEEPRSRSSSSSSREEQQQQRRDSHQKIRRFYKGDIIAIPPGTPYWTYNHGNEPLVAVSLLDTSNFVNQLDSTPRIFYVGGNPDVEFLETQQQQEQGRHQQRHSPGGRRGGQHHQEGEEEQQQQQNEGNSVLSGFSSEFLAQALNTDEDTARRLQSPQDERRQIVRVEGGLRIISPDWQEEEDEEQEEGGRPSHRRPREEEEDEPRRRGQREEEEEEEEEQGPRRHQRPSQERRRSHRREEDEEEEGQRRHRRHSQGEEEEQTPRHRHSREEEDEDEERRRSHRREEDEEEEGQRRHRRHSQGEEEEQTPRHRHSREEEDEDEEDEPSSRESRRSSRRQHKRQPSRRGEREEEEDEEEQDERRTERHSSRGSRSRGCGKNGLEETICTAKIRENIARPSRADLYNPRAGRISTVNSLTLPILRYLRLGAEYVVLYKNGIYAPHWNINANSLMYVIRGRGRVQIVNCQGNAVFDDEVRKGQLLVVPQNFVVAQQAGDEGFEFVAFKTNDRATVSHVKQVFRATPAEVLENAFGLRQREITEIKFSGNRGPLVHPQSHSHSRDGVIAQVA